MPIIDDPRYTQDAVAGPVKQPLLSPREQEEETPSTLATLAAASRRATLAGAAYERVANSDPDMPDAPPGWDPLDHIQGYEEHADSLAGAPTPSDLAGRLARIDAGRADSETLRRAGIGTGAEIAMSMLDPTFLVAAAAPEVAAGAKVAQIGNAFRVARFGRAALEGAAGAGLYEAGMQSLRDDRSATESLLNIGGGALLGGVLGSILARAPVAETQAARATIDQESARSTAGAAARMGDSTLERESLAAGGKQLSRAVGEVPLIGTDLDKVLSSDSVVANQVLQELADVPGILGKNLEGEATPTSVEAMVSRHDARLADFSDELKRRWVEYRKRVGKDGMSQGDFHTAVASAARRGDSIGVPEVDASAKFLRERVFDPLKDDALSLGLLDDPVKVAQKKADDHAVGQYVKAEARQIYADYRARVSQAIAQTDAAAALRGETGLTGDALRSGERSAAVRTELERAVEVERQASARTLDDIEARLTQAEGELDQAVARLRGEREQNLAAVREQNEANRAAAGAQTGAARQNLTDELARALSVERGVRVETVNRIEEVFEQAQRAYRRELSRIGREVAPGKRKEARTAAQLVRERARTERAAALERASAEFERGRGQLVATHGKAAIKAAGKVARETPSLRGAYQFGRDVERARSKLQRARNIAARQRTAERARLRESLARLEHGASKEMEKLQPMSRAKFMKRAERALRGQTDDTPEVTKLGQLLRDQQAGRLGSRVTARKVRPEDVSRVRGAASYFRRMYDRDAVRASLPEWRATLRQWFTRSGQADAAEIDAAIEDVTRKILGADVGQSNFATKITVSKAGPLQERLLDIPDELIEKFLVNDPMKVAAAYVRDLAPQVEMARKFGDVDMKQQIQSISDDFAVQRKRVEGSDLTPAAKAKALKKLQKQELQATESLVRIRDRILNRAGRLGPDASEGTRRAVAASKAWRNWVASARLGATAVTGGTMDLARIAAQYGFMPTVTKLVKLATSPAFRALSKQQARRAGSAVEVALSRRVNAAYDGAITEGWSEKLANGVYKYTGLNHLTDFNRTLAATLLEDEVLKTAQKVALGEKAPKFARARLASLGIGDEELQRIAQQVEQHGGEVDGVHVSGSADWQDKALADLYDAAILKESKIVVQQPGAADRVWWMDKETGKLIGQLKSFALSAPARLLSMPVQAVAQGRYGYAARFVGYMMMGGYLTHSLRQVVAGKLPTTDPRAAAAEALTESGVLGVFPDLLSPVGRRLGMGESVRYGDRNALSAYGGPALGFAGDAYDFAMNRTQGGMSASDLHMLRRMIPYNNVWYLRRAINALEGETAEALDMQGADVASPFQRMVRTDAVLPAAERGGTGTGMQ